MFSLENFMNMSIGCLILRLFLILFIFNFDKSFIYLRKLFILIELNVHVFCNYVNDIFTTVLMNTKLRGFDRPCLGKINCFTL